MEGVKRLFAASKRIYLGVLILIIACSSIDCFYICSDNLIPIESEDYIKEQAQNVSVETLFSQMDVSFGDVFANRLTEMDGFFVFFVVLVGILIVLVFKGFSFVDERAREFRATWPVKSWVRELYDYAAVLVVVLAGFLFQLLVLLVVQMQRNNMLLENLGLDRTDTVISSIIETANATLVSNMLYYMFSIALLYTWIYLGMTLVKNPIIGVVGALAIQISIFYVCDIWIWRFIQDYAYDYMVCDVNEYEIWFYVYKIMMTICCLIFDSFAGACYNSAERCFEENYYFAGKELQFCSLETWMLVKIIMFVFLLVGIVLAAKKKDLTKGKVLYFPILDYLLALYAGFVGATIGSELIIAYDPRNITPYNVFACVVVGVIVMVVVFLLLHPRILKKQQHLEVK